jgi:hypothetical protein
LEGLNGIGMAKDMTNVAPEPVVNLGILTVRKFLDWLKTINFSEEGFVAWSAIAVVVDTNAHIKAVTRRSNI